MGWLARSDNVDRDKHISDLADDAVLRSWLVETRITSALRAAPEPQRGARPRMVTGSSPARLDAGPASSYNVESDRQRQSAQWRNAGWTEHSRTSQVAEWTWRRSAV
jgi:hypothetical protein